MIEVIEHGNRYNPEKKTFLCTSCWCKFTASKEDYKDATRKDGFSLTHYFACSCPECRREASELT